MANKYRENEPVYDPDYTWCSLLDYHLFDHYNAYFTVHPFLDELDGDDECYYLVSKQNVD